MSQVNAPHFGSVQKPHFASAQHPVQFGLGAEHEPVLEYARAALAFGSQSNLTHFSSERPLPFGSTKSWTV